jgi:vancomycin permeability regulator SanA
MIKQTRVLLAKYKWLKRVVFFLAFWILAHVTYITIDGMNEDISQADIAIVLGNRVESDGSLPSWTRGRVDRALELYKNGTVKLIFVSGGITKETGAMEAKAMKSYLVKQGVPENAVIEDNAGINTYHTAINFLNWNKEKQYSSVVIVSQFYHITRSRYILRKTGFEGNIYSASSRKYRWQDITGTLREVPAFYKYLLAY